MSRSVALTQRTHDELVAHLARADGQEDLCFGLWHPSRGVGRESALVVEAILPRADEHHVHGNVAFVPEYLQRAIQLALEKGTGLAFLHSHPASGWQGMSPDDVRAEQGMAGAVMSATDLPLLGMTVGAIDDSWSARTWHREAPRVWRPEWCETVRVVGESLQVTYCDRLLLPPRVTEAQIRTVSVFGVGPQANLARLRVGIVGLGSVGMLVAEGLARHGIERLSLFDFDVIEELNRDRVLHSRQSVVGLPKVHVAGERLQEAATAENFEVTTFELSICEQEGYRQALDCDVLFSCVDRPWPRSVLNFIAYAHLIPVIDGGIKVVCKSDGTLRSADWKAHVATHGNKCLRCHRQYDPELVSLERYGHLDDPSYIEGLPEDHPARARQNVFVFSMDAAARELRQFFMLTAAPSGRGAAFGENYHFVTGDMDHDTTGCEAGCEFAQLQGLGEDAGHPGTGEHDAAKRARRSRERPDLADSSLMSAF